MAREQSCDRFCERRTQHRVLIGVEGECRHAGLLMIPHDNESP